MANYTQKCDIRYKLCCHLSYCVLYSKYSDMRCDYVLICSLFFFFIVRCKHNNSGTCHRPKLCVQFVEHCDPRQITDHCSIMEFGTSRLEMDFSVAHLRLCMPLLCTWVLYILLHSKFKVFVRKSHTQCVHIHIY